MKTSSILLFILSFLLVASLMIFVSYSYAGGTVAFEWSAQPDTDEFRLHRSVDGGPFVRQDVKIPGDAHTVTVVAPEVCSVYHLTAANSTMVSGPSNSVEVCPPGVPEGFKIMFLIGD